MTCTTDCVKIEEIFDAMIRLAYQVLPENRRGVNMRISTTESTIKIRFELLLEKAKSKCLLFIPDAHGQTLFPMFYLSLKRDLEIISLARKHVLTDHETYESLVTILSISGAALDRIKSLRSIFEQQSPDNPRTHPDLSLFASRVPPKRGFGGGHRDLYGHVVDSLFLYSQKNRTCSQGRPRGGATVGKVSNHFRDSSPSMDPIALMKTRPRSRCNVLAELGLLSCSSIKCEWSMLVWSASVEACSAIRLLRFYIGHTTASGFPWPCLMGLLGRLVDGGFLDPQRLHLGVDLMFASHYSRHPGSKRPPGCRPSGTAEVWSGHPQLQARCQQFWRSDSDHNPPVFRILVFYARILSEIIVVIFARLLAFRAPTEELDIPSAIHTPVFLTPKAGAPKLQRCGVSTIANDIRNVGYPSPSPTPRMKSLVMLVATVDTCPSTLNGLAGAHITVIQFSTQFSALLKDCNVPTDESNEDVLKCLLYTPRSISGRELEVRSGLRRTRVLIVDPAAARSPPIPSPVTAIRTPFKRTFPRSSSFIRRQQRRCLLIF
ncbi:hypothetical protein BJ322DRAFT_1154215 [Thelephora terrestris]|uniref:Uncharacterized protein n=1 Tax=Thelephora terrestris TaxID=56493 RepID=A0A9P6HR00_9AGAM|nr:hypothetical protein BJ322DRAFT_1154215 [Thelephora terrestris]